MLRQQKKNIKQLCPSEKNINWFWAALSKGIYLIKIIYCKIENRLLKIKHFLF